MKNKKLQFLLLISTVMFLIWIFRPERIKIDGILGDISELFLETDTKYSNGYTHQGFNKIKIGMTEQEVLDILGEPLIKWSPYRKNSHPKKAHYLGLQYSESPSNTHYRLRQIYIDSGKVKEIIGYFYVD